MKNLFCRAKQVLVVFAFLAGSGLSGSGFAALTDIAQYPISSTGSSAVRPNIMFSLDDSGSMAWSHNPDDASAFVGDYGYTSSQCNGAYYDPSIKYVPPRNADGTLFPNATFTSAWVNGFSTGAGTVDLSTSFYEYDNTSSNGAGTATGKPAFYYVYTGTETFKDYANTSSTFYKECNKAIPASNPITATITVSGNKSTVVSSIKVNGVETMSGSSSSSSKASTVASNVDAKISKNGFSSSVSGSVITVTGPANSEGFDPVISSTSGGMTFSVTTFAPSIQTNFDYVAVSATSGPGATDERQNFANWFSYYRTRILLMKTGVGRAFVGIGASYRVGFTTIHNTSTTTSSIFLPIADFDSTQKPAWYTKLYARTPGSGTPLRNALSFVGRMYAGKLAVDPVQYSCQQNFVILSTDGYWNNDTNIGYQMDGVTPVGNTDNNETLMPRPKYDGGVSGATNTLSDVAAYYYNTDLRDASTLTAAQCKTGVSGADVCKDNVPTSGLDSAPHQHMTTFTLGLGVSGQLRFTDDYLTGGSADFNAIKGGSKNWPLPVGDTRTAVDDLWHAAVNGNGQFFSARNPDLLVSGLGTALASVAAREAAGAAAATSNLEPVSGDNFAYVANYRTVKWDGDLAARAIDLSTGAISNTDIWSAQAQLDPLVSASSDSRTIYTFSAGGTNKLKAFLPASFTSTEKANWFTPANSPVLSQYSTMSSAEQAAATADTLINYLRGQYGNDDRATNTNKLYRSREHVLGDVIDGKPVFIKLPPFKYTENSYNSFKTGTTVTNRAGIVYLAANDGMLHAFASATGVENWAYIPSFVLPKLKNLADTTYSTNHVFTVDGSPVVTDIYDGTNWKTILVGGLNAGGMGYYALDITDPATPKALWEYSDSNLGLTFGNPLIGKLSDGTWVVIFASGYNNTSDGHGRLYVLNAATGALKFTIDTGVGTSTSPAGLAKISGFVTESLVDATILRVYGGDLLGNLWRFDINDLYPPSGKDAVLLASFKVGSTPQPITTKPELGQVGGKPIVFVGTGKYLGASDASDSSQQSFYAVVDNLTATGIGLARDSSITCPLVQQTITIIDANRRTTSNNTVDFSSKCGWYLDFNPGTSPGDSPGERVNVDPKLQLGVIALATNVPETSACTVGGSSWLYFLDSATGARVSTTVNTSLTAGLAGSKVGNSLVVGLNTYRLPDGKTMTTTTTSDDKHPVFGNPDNPGGGSSGKRVSWRELIN